ncbi:prefoldin subunit 3 [Monosporozyma unispora]|nr:prefoldin subunit 3 [Kazachstania unispora]
MDTLFNSTETNPRGIPSAPFVEDLTTLFNDGKNDFQLVFNKFQERLQKYKFMQESKQVTLKQLNTRIPEISQSLKVCQLLESQNADDKDEDSEDLLFNYSLNDTLYTKASVNPKEVKNVGLWLGADVMLEYPIPEAITLLQAKLDDSQSSLHNCQEDLEFLRENITTMEVMCARLYNWDVEQRRKDADQAK